MHEFVPLDAGPALRSQNHIVHGQRIDPGLAECDDRVHGRAHAENLTDFLSYEVFLPPPGSNLSQGRRFFLLACQSGRSLRLPDAERVNTPPRADSNTKLVRVEEDP